MRHIILFFGIHPVSQLIESGKIVFIWYFLFFKHKLLFCVLDLFYFLDGCGTRPNSEQFYIWWNYQYASLRLIKTFSFQSDRNQIPMYIHLIRKQEDLGILFSTDSPFFVFTMPLGLVLYRKPFVVIVTCCIKF